MAPAAGPACRAEPFGRPVASSAEGLLAEAASADEGGGSRSGRIQKERPSRLSVCWRVMKKQEAELVGEISKVNGRLLPEAGSTPLVLVLILLSYTAWCRS